MNKTNEGGFSEPSCCEKQGKKQENAPYHDLTILLDKNMSKCAVIAVSQCRHGRTDHTSHAARQAFTVGNMISTRRHIFYGTPLWTALAVVFHLIFCTLSPAQAQSFAIIRDAEIEQTLRKIATPVFEAADIDPQRIRLVIIKDDGINAFVAGGMNIYIYTGLIMAAENPEELLGVIAHETGHIAGGHLARGSDSIMKSGRTAVASTILGILLAAASGSPDAGMAAMSVGQHVATTSFLSNSRSQENAADQAALYYLDHAGLTSGGLLSFFEKLHQQELLPASQQVEYLRTHPLTRDRITAVREGYLQSQAKDIPLSPEIHSDFDRMRAKLTGYLSPPAETLRKYDHAPLSVTERYARALAYYQDGRQDQALSDIDQLIAEEPENPYFHELKGQVLFEGGQIDTAIDSFRQAVDLAPESGLIRLLLAHALVEQGHNQSYQEAIDNLTKALSQEDQTPRLHRLMAIAYGRLGQQPMAELHLAEEALLQGRKEDADRKARLALSGLEEGSSAWFHAQDILALLEAQ